MTESVERAGVKSQEICSRVPATLQLRPGSCPFLSKPQFLCLMRMGRTSQVSWKSIVSSGVRMFGTRCRTGGRAWLLSGPCITASGSSHSWKPGTPPWSCLSYAVHPEPRELWSGGKGLAERVRAEQVPPTSDPPQEPDPQSRPPWFSSCLCGHSRFLHLSRGNHYSTCL